MCRHLAYLGPPRHLASLLLEPEHGLLRQSYAPRQMRGGGTVNADGFGVGWFPPGRPERPARYRTERPLWSDDSFAELAGATQAPSVLAAIRSATVGMPVVSTACAPFTWGCWLFSHNGVVRGWPSSVSGLAARLPVADLLTLDAPTDSALLWALVRHRLAAGARPAAALAEVVASVAEAAPGSKLNLLLTDGSMIYATTWGHALSTCTEPGATVVASEPHDAAPGWRPVPDGHLVVARAGSVSWLPIDPSGERGAQLDDVVADREGI